MNTTKITVTIGSEAVDFCIRQLHDEVYKVFVNGGLLSTGEDHVITTSFAFAKQLVRNEIDTLLADVL